MQDNDSILTFYDLDGNGDIDQKECKTILIQSSIKFIQKMAFIIGLELYGLTKVSELISLNLEHRKNYYVRKLYALTKIFNIHSKKMKNRKFSS